MTAFEHVTALFSFVYALALTHLLARIAELVVARERVRFSGLLALGMVNAVILVFCNWLSLWDLHVIKAWDLGSITIQFLFAVNVFLICVLVGPKAHDDGPLIWRISIGDSGRISMAPSWPAPFCRWSLTLIT